MRISEKERQALRVRHKAWLDKIMAQTGLTLTEIGREAEGINAGTLRTFYTGKGVLSDKVMLAVYKRFGIEPDFDAWFQYRAENDESDITEYAKLCKEYITQVCVQLGIYRKELAQLIELKSDMVFTRLFSGYTPSGLEKTTLIKIKEKSRIPFPPKLAAQMPGSEEHGRIPVVGYLELAAGDEVIFYPDDQINYVEPLANVSAKTGKAIELKGPTVSAILRDGMRIYYNDVPLPVSKDCLNRLCMVQTPEGVTAIKRVTVSSRKGIYNLQSLVDNKITPSALEWAIPLTIATL
jgi:hypothetical protein